MTMQTASMLGGAPDPLAMIVTQPMRPSQVVAVLVCFVFFALNGFDVLAMTFVAPGIAADRQVGPDAICTIIAAGLVGIVVGSLSFSQMADRIGRGGRSCSASRS